ncbi:leucine-rich repeat protein lrrA-like [Watersipora subatra]|uniref:leucine-rich repeat protein lrrA-like n=1 Tax=Watersipora subatra TaxID=2589382 RepID=UPI00355B7F61
MSDLQQSLAVRSKHDHSYISAAWSSHWLTPQILGSLTNLKELNISWNKLDYDSLVGIEKLVSLEKLDMKFCDLKKLPFRFDSLTSLKELNISSNKLDSDSMVGMEKLMALEKLSLHSCDLTKLPLSSLDESLETPGLYKSSKPVSTTDACTDQKESKTFDLAAEKESLRSKEDDKPNDVYGNGETLLGVKISWLPITVFYRFESLTNLKELDISSSKLDSDSPVGMNKLMSLKKLNLHDCGLPKFPFRFDSLTNLKELDISMNKLDSDSLVGMGKLMSLEKLYMCSCDLMKLSFSFDSLTNLKELDLNLNKLDSDSLVGIEKLVSLEKLILSSLIKLRDLALWGNPLNPETLDEIVKLDSLEYLDLGSCQLAKLPSGFKRLKKLRKLRLRKNYFEEYPSVLRSLPRHTSIDIRDSDFSKHSTTRVPHSSEDRPTLHELHTGEGDLVKKPTSTKGD